MADRWNKKKSYGNGNNRNNNSNRNNSYSKSNTQWGDKNSKWKKNEHYEKPAEVEENGQAIAAEQQQQPVDVDAGVKTKKFSKKNKQLDLEEIGMKWWEKEEKERENAISDPKNFFINQGPNKMKQKANEILQADSKQHQESIDTTTDSDLRWMQTVLKSGTLSDKIAAMTLMIQQNPLHTLKTLDTMLDICQSKGRREALLAIGAVKDLFLNDLLPDRKLLTFESAEHIAVPKVTRTLLKIWLFEHELKLRYRLFIATCLEAGTNDILIHHKKHIMKYTFELLSNKPENEGALLSLLTNKLGDPERKIASWSVFLLEKLMKFHPMFKPIIVTEVDRLIFRPRVSEKAQYYGVVFLNQILFTRDDSTLPTKLISIYFALFKTLIARDDVNSRMLGALLTGVNRAYPYINKEEDNKEFDDQIELLFKVSHTQNFNIAIQSLLLLYQVTQNRPTISDRFYRTLYEKLFSPEFRNSTKQKLFLNLLYKSIKNDADQNRVCAFVKRVLQAAIFQSPSFICAALYLISEITKQHNVVKFLLTQPEYFAGEDEEHFVDAPEDEDAQKGEEEQDEEDFEEAHSENDDDDDKKKKKKKAKLDKPKQSSVHAEHEYDPLKREPRFANAKNSCLWELNILSVHYHPSVVVFARTLLKGGLIRYKSDPLEDFTTTNFLDRFMYKNPKKVAEARNPLSKTNLQDKLVANTAAFRQQKASSVPVHEMFMHKFFNQKEKLQPSKQKSNKKKKTEEEEEEEFAERVIEEKMREDSNNQGPDMDEEFDDELSAFSEESDQDAGESDAEEGEGEESAGEESEEEEEDDDEEEEVKPKSKKDKKTKSKKEVSEEEESEEESALDFSDDDDDDDDGADLDDGGDVSDGELNALLGSEFEDSEEETAQIPDRLAGKTSSVFADPSEFADILDEAGEEEDYKPSKKYAEYLKEQHKKPRHANKKRRK